MAGSYRLFEEGGKAWYYIETDYFKLDYQEGSYHFTGSVCHTPCEARGSLQAFRQGQLQTVVYEIALNYDGLLAYYL